MYKIIEIESKNEIEQLGTKEKYWIYDEKEKVKKLFKIGRENTGKDCAEVLCLSYSTYYRVASCKI